MKKGMLIVLPLLSLVILSFIGVATASVGDGSTTTDNSITRIGIAIAAALAISLPAIAAAYAISSAGSAAISAMAEKPETFFKSFLIVALAEALAIYGLIMGILLWLKL